jgi:hypothetical protein
MKILRAELNEQDGRGPLEHHSFDRYLTLKYVGFHYSFLWPNQLLGVCVFCVVFI